MGKLGCTGVAGGAVIVWLGDRLIGALWRRGCLWRASPCLGGGFGCALDVPGGDVCVQAVLVLALVCAERVPKAAHCADGVGFACFGQSATQAADMDVDRSGFDVRADAPHHVEQLFA